jgi:hypothetical protein
MLNRLINIILIFLILNINHSKINIIPAKKTNLNNINFNNELLFDFNAAFESALNYLSSLKPKKLKVSKVKTNISEQDLLAVLRESHTEVFGRPPNKARIHMAWAQIAFENGRGKKVYNHNLGNIGGNPIKPVKSYYMVSGYRFRSFKNFNDGAKYYWKIIKNRCPSSLAYFDAGDPHMASVALKRCGYYRADLEHYSKNLSSLFFESYKKEFL